MYMNLFSIFDSSTSIRFSINWLRSMLLIMYLPYLYWLIPSRWNIFILLLINYLLNELSVLINKKINLINILIYIRLFFFVIINNFLGLFSYIFTSTSHLVTNLTLSLPLWISIIIFGWLNNLNHIFIHLVPQGTPGILMPFIVLIETVRNLIRSGTLAVRLAANIIAGHLLITLISSTGNSLRIFLLLLMLISQRILILLELSVAIIQAYVFSVLRRLYRIETN